MKKVIFMLAAIAMVMSACTSTEVIEESLQSNAIGFASHVNKASRAIENATFSQFNVFGCYKTNSGNTIDIFNDIAVTKVDNTWSYSEARYWVEDASYSFAAYAVDENALPVGCRANFANGILNINGFLANAGNQKDIVYAKAGPIIGKKTGNDVVPMTFKHILSKINFHFVSNFPAGYTIKIKNARVNNVRDKGNYLGASLTWSDVDRTASDIQVFPNFPNGSEASAKNGNVDAIEATTDYIYVIPFEYTANNVDIIFDIEVYNGDEKIITREGIKGTWAPKWYQNQTYTYNINISGNAAGLEEIKFTGSVSDWTEGTPATPEFNLGGGDVPVENN